jgi:hypothetical protein
MRMSLVPEAIKLKLSIRSRVSILPINLAFPSQEPCLSQVN